MQIITTNLAGNRALQATIAVGALHPSGHTFIDANGAIVGVMIFAMVALFGAAGYLAKRVYYDKKYFTPAYEQQYYESELEDAVHDN